MLSTLIDREQAVGDGDGGGFWWKERQAPISLGFNSAGG